MSKSFYCDKRFFSKMSDRSNVCLFTRIIPVKWFIVTGTPSSTRTILACQCAAYEFHSETDFLFLFTTINAHFDVFSHYKNISFSQDNVYKSRSLELGNNVIIVGQNASVNYKITKYYVKII